VSFIHLSDRSLYLDACVLISLVVSAYALWLLVAWLRRSRPDLSIGRAVAVAFIARFVAAAALGSLSVGAQLRGGDEGGFLSRAHELVTHPLGSPASIDKLTGELHTFLFSVNLRIFHPDPPLLMLRVEMITLSVIGLALLAAAVHELAGARAAKVAAWILALEPANVFFSSLLHKEPFMYLAEGAVAYGGAVYWNRGKLWALVPMVLGCLVATATRPYAGWFLAAAAVAVVLHASLTRHQGARALAIAGLMVLLIVAFFPQVWNASSRKSLTSLQESQNANAADTQANLSLERVDYSTRDKLITNLPQRVSDMVLKPYPWQTQNASQRLGILGTLVMLVALGFFLVAVVRDGRVVMQRAGPLIYPALFMLVAYALSAGNAGTAYRYRTHVVGILLCLVVVLWYGRRQEEVAEAPSEALMWRTFETGPRLAK
jgi:hypothetical protein